MKRFNEEIDLEKWAFDYEDNFCFPKRQSMFKIVYREANKKVNFFKKYNNFNLQDSPSLIYAFHLLKGSNKKSLDWCKSRFKRRFNKDYDMHNFYNVFDDNNDSLNKWRKCRLQIENNTVCLNPFFPKTRYRSLIINGEIKFFDHKTVKWVRANHEFDQRIRKLKRNLKNFLNNKADYILQDRKMQSNNNKKFNQN